MGCRIGVEGIARTQVVTSIQWARLSQFAALSRMAIEMREVEQGLSKNRSTFQWRERAKGPEQTRTALALPHLQLNLSSAQNPTFLIRLK